MTCSTGNVPIRNLVIPQATDWEEVFTIKTGGVVVDITGSAFQGHIRKDATSSTKTAEFSFSLNEATNEVTYSLAADDSDVIPVGKLPTDAASKYVYDIEWTDSGGKKRMAVRGQITFIPNTTRGA